METLERCSLFAGQTNTADVKHWRQHMRSGHVINLTMRLRESPLGEFQPYDIPPRFICKRKAQNLIRKGKSPVLVLVFVMCGCEIIKTQAVQYAHIYYTLTYPFPLYHQGDNMIST